jgi:hypothetical protein
MLIVLTFGFSANGNATAVRNNNEADINIVGAVSCGDWDNDHSHFLAAASWGEYWLIGFLSGIAAGSNMDFMKDADANSIVIWMNNYCSNHPLDSVSAGANILMNELIRKMH